MEGQVGSHDSQIECVCPAAPATAPLVLPCEHRCALCLTCPRLFHSAIVHADASHLVSNLVAIAPACVARERRLGSSRRMAAELLVLTALSQGLDVGWAVFQRRVRDRPHLYFKVGGVGLSSVVFAVQVRGTHHIGAGLLELKTGLPVFGGPCCPSVKRERSAPLGSPLGSPSGSPPDLPLTSLDIRLSNMTPRVLAPPHPSNASGTAARYARERVRSCGHTAAARRLS